MPHLLQTLQRARLITRLHSPQIWSNLLIHPICTRKHISQKIELPAYQKPPRMARPPTISVMFLGTSSGGGPSETRNCSSLVVDGLGNGDLWSMSRRITRTCVMAELCAVVDCAEGTVRQFAMQPGQGEQRFKVARVRKIFITHMHGPHYLVCI